jgi:hypothetical protein
MESSKSAQLELNLNDFHCSLRRIKASRLTLGHGAALPKVDFDLGADIKETETAKGRLRLKYTLFIDTNPAVERAELQGEVTITSAAISAVTDLQVLGEEKISEIAMLIYKRNYEIIYLTFESAGLVAPTPWLIQDAHLVPGVIDDTSVPTKPLVSLAAPIAQ